MTARACKPAPCTHRDAEGKPCRPCRDAAFADWSRHPTCQREVGKFVPGKGVAWCGAPARYYTSRIVLGMFEEIRHYCRAHKPAGAKLNRRSWAHGCIGQTGDALDGLAATKVTG